MKKNILLRILIISLSLGIILIGYFYMRRNPAGRIQAVGDLNVIWGVPDGDPIFVVENMLPGDTESRTITIVNNASQPRPIAVRGIERYASSGDFTNVLEFSISENSSFLYGSDFPGSTKLLSDFFSETATPSSIPSGSLNPGESKDYTFKVYFQSHSGNEFQRSKVIFDIIIGIDSEIPAECQHIEFSGPPIYGTERRDRIYGTLGNDLIYALEGNDRVASFLGDDCIVGGPGNDELRGEVGNDIIFGNEGNDKVIGAQGMDILFGGSGDDVIRGEHNDDYIEGNNGNDKITGGSGNDLIYGNEGDDRIFSEAGDDTVYGGNGNDYLDGGSGNDIIYGQIGDDILHGKSNNDQLYGGADIDFAHGWSGIDTCVAETTKQCEY